MMSRKAAFWSVWIAYVILCGAYGLTWGRINPFLFAIGMVGLMMLYQFSSGPLAARLSKKEDK